MILFGSLVQVKGLGFALVSSAKRWMAFCAPDHRLGLAGRLHDLGSAATIGGQKNDFRSPNVLLWAVAVRHHRFKFAAVGSAQSDIPSLVHSADSHTRVRQGIPRRIEMSDLLH